MIAPDGPAAGLLGGAAAASRLDAGEHEFVPAADTELLVRARALARGATPQFLFASREDP